MNDTHGGGSERIAPIIPLFGAKTSRSRPTSITPHVPASDFDGDDADAGTPSERHPARGASTRMAPLSSSAGGEPASPRRLNPESASVEPADARPEIAGPPEERPAPRLRALHDPQADHESAEDRKSPDEVRAAGEESLLRKLRAKSLSISEARLVLRGHHLDSGQIDDVIDDFCRRSYLDDAVLAGLLVTSGVERKGQGRIALSRALSQRGIPRDVIDAALDDLPDDDSERALDFARSKARSMSRLDNDTALRRLVGQLSRRGYNGAVAMSAAKAALREVGSGGSASGVRFVDSD